MCLNVYLQQQGQHHEHMCCGPLAVAPHHVCAVHLMKDAMQMKSSGTAPECDPSISHAPAIELHEVTPSPGMVCC